MRSPPRRALAAGSQSVRPWAVFAPRASRWWGQYRSTLTLSAASVESLRQASLSIVGALPDPLSWGKLPTPFRGLVVGSIQSGKTAAMIGITAVALDQGFKVIVVLAGTKDDLRRQTARRFNTHLLRQCDMIPDAGGATTLGRPPGPGPLGG